MDYYKEAHNLKVENRAFINGEYVNAKSGVFYYKRSSYDAVELPGIADCDETDIDEAVDAARCSFESGVWSNYKLSEKKRVLLKLADLMEANRKELALLDTLETNRAYSNYYNDSIPKAIDSIRYYAEAIDKYYDFAIPPQKTAFATVNRIPIGVVGIILPWNDPMVVAAWKFTPALLMGNSVVIKPAEQSSYSLIKTAVLAKEAGIPDGVFNVVPGRGETAGKALAMNTDVGGVFFTGSSEVGKLIMQYSGQSNMKKVGLECGGKSAFILSSKSVNINNAVKILAQNVFYNQGQICTAPSRAIVYESIYDDFIKLLYKECDNYVPGSPFESDNNVGCVVSKVQYDRINEYIDFARTNGGTVFQSSKIKKKNNNACAVQPTVITGLCNDSRLAQEEIFGPVVTVLKSKDIHDAIGQANSSKYGLAGAIFTDDINEAYYGATHINAGLVHINSWGEDEMHVPFGGIKESGVGKDRSFWAFDEYSELKTVWMKFENI